MRTLSHLYSLEHCIRLYVPGTVNVNEDAAALQEATVLRVLDSFSTWFGGATAYNAKGAYKSAVAGLVMEPIVIVESYATSAAVNVNMEHVIALCESIKDEMSQEAVALEYDNRLYFV